MIYKLLVTGVLISWAILSPLHGMDEEKEFPERIKVRTIAAYEELLFAHGQEASLNPQDTFFLLTDWDCTVVAISNLDRKNFLRQENTGAVVDSFKKRGVPVAVVTARWKHQSNPTEYLVNMAHSMEENTGIVLSDQVAFKNLQLDLRQESLKRGIFVEGICFSGSPKGLVTSALIDHPSIVKATHYFFVDDDLEKISQMIETFKKRTEKLTAFYYPDKLGKEIHPLILHQHSIFPPIRKLSFLIRHDYIAEVQELLKDSEVLRELTTTNITPLLIDLVHSTEEQIAEHVLEKLNFTLREQDIEEIIILLEQKLSNFEYRPFEPVSIRWILKDLSPNTLLSISLRLLSDKPPPIIIQHFFNSAPNLSSLILNIFSYSPSQGSPTLLDSNFFQHLVGAGIVKREFIPELEKRAEKLDSMIVFARLLNAKALIS